jgi:hypothetical protein
MKKKVGICWALALALAFPVMVGSAAAAVVDLNGPVSLDTLIAGSAAGTQYRVEDKIFSGFNYSFSGSPGVQAVTASSITVTPLTDALNPGLQFTGLWFAQAGESLVSGIGYAVATAPGGNATSGMSLDVLGGSAGPGVVAAFESAHFPGAGSASLMAYATGTRSNLFDSAAFDPTTGVFRVTEGIGVISRGLFAEILVVKNQFAETPSSGSPVPIPGSILLLGPGLAGLVIVRKRLASNS